MKSLSPLVKVMLFLSSYIPLGIIYIIIDYLDLKFQEKIKIIPIHEDIYYIKEMI